MKSKRAYAVVNKEKPVIRLNDIFESNDVAITKSEKIIRIEIKEINGK